MDPLSIATSALSIAASLYSVSQSIYSFVTAAKNVDRTAQSLKSQVEGLSNVLKSLGNTLKHPLLLQLAQENLELWQQVGESVAACRTTANDLLAVLEPFIVPSGTHIKQAWRQFKLDLAKDEIERLQSATRTHSINIQLSIGILNVLLCSSSPNMVINEQNIRFERLEKMMCAIDLRLQASDNSHTLAEAGKIGRVAVNKQTVGLRRAAGSIMSSASTAAGRSVQSGAESHVALDPDMVFDYHDSTCDDSPDDISSTTGSEFGVPLRDAQKAEIRLWMQETPQIKEDIEAASSSLKSREPGAMFSDLSISSETQMTEMTELFDDSSEDDIDMQIVRSISSNANNEFDKKQYAAAEALLKSSLEHSQRLTYKQQEALDTKEMRLKYAVCKSCIGKLEESEEMLLMLAKEPVRNNSDAKRLFEAIHNLAIIHLRKNNLDVAENHCRQALRGRRKTKAIGKAHSDYFASVKLYAAILWAQGDKILTQAYLDMLPYDMKLGTGDLNAILTSEYFYEFAPEATKSTESEDKFSGNEMATATAVGRSRDVASEANSTLVREVSADHIVCIQQDDSRKYVEMPESRSLSNPTNSSTAASLATQETSIGPLDAETSVENRLNLQLTSTEKQLGDAEASIKKKGYHKTGRANEGVLWAAKNGKLHEVNYLFQGFVVDVNYMGTSWNHREKTALHLSARRGHIEVCARLLQKAWRVDLSDFLGKTPLIEAIEGGFIEICRLLLQHGARLTGQPYSPKYLLPLSVAAGIGSLEICKLLQEKGVPINAVDLKGRTALMAAARYGRLAICKFLLNSGADAEQMTIASKTALVYADQAGHRAICKLLKDRGVWR